VEPCSALADVPGFRVSGIGCDIRQKGDLSRLDLGILHSEAPCDAAGVFTRNRVRAAPVTYCEGVLAQVKTVHGVVANSGNANACTGATGASNTTELARLAEQATGAASGSFFVASTGRIGRQLPMDAMRQGITLAASRLSSDKQAGLDFAQAILTSDTRDKKMSLRITNGEQTVHLSGAAKGAGMIRPDMATMLAFIATDAGIDRITLQSLLKQCVDLSFNAITVDGDMSTNDTVLLLANGVSGITWQSSDEGFRKAFADALLKICEHLAYLIVGDGEKISKVVTLNICGAANDEDARKVGYAIGQSALVKSSWAGSDPNWGRVLCAVGYAGVAVVEQHLSMHYDEVPVVIKGQPMDENLPQWKAIVARKQFTIRVDLAMGDAEARLIASDLTPDYITFNMKE
jgi:glutamate N-acetyltransferase / amino-acid N-acetyltransferase